jgi:type I restriction-modification system DNA methylase subunit
MTQITESQLESYPSYDQSKDEPGFTRVATLNEIRTKGSNLTIPLYVVPTGDAREKQHTTNESLLPVAISAWQRRIFENVLLLRRVEPMSYRPLRPQKPYTLFVKRKEQVL